MASPASFAIEGRYDADVVAHTTNVASSAPFGQASRWRPGTTYLSYGERSHRGKNKKEKATLPQSTVHMLRRLNRKTSACFALLTWIASVFFVMIWPLICCIVAIEVHIQGWGHITTDVAVTARDRGSFFHATNHEGKFVLGTRWRGASEAATRTNRNFPLHADPLPAGHA